MVGDSETAFRLLNPLAEQGVPEAAYYLGLLDDNSWGAPLDDREAIKWYRLAAEQDYAPAQYSVPLSPCSQMPHAGLSGAQGGT